MRKECTGKLKFQLLFAVCFCLFFSQLAYSIILHDDNQPAVHPDNGVIGKWSSNASCVAIGKRYIITTGHQGGGVGTNILINGQNYKVADELYVGSDIRVARIENLNSSQTSLSEFASIYYDPQYTRRLRLKPITIGGYGKIRGTPLVQDNTIYGYLWASNVNNSLHWGNNIIDSVGDEIEADFDGPSVAYECAIALHDSGGGWFYDNQLIGLSYRVDPYGASGQSWFLNPNNITDPDPSIGDRFYAWSLNDYKSLIEDSIAEPSIPGSVSANPGQGCGEIEITWSAISGIDSYNIYYSQDSNDDLILYSNISSQETSLVINNLIPNQTYHFAITSVSGIAESDISGLATVVASADCQYSINGTVLDYNGTALGNVDIILDDISTTTLSDGNYTATVPYGWTGNIVPSKAGYKFEPALITISTPVTSNLSDRNFDVNIVDFVSDNFDDNLKNANWIMETNGSIYLWEENQRLEVWANGEDIYSQTSYTANDWNIDANESFSFKINIKNSVTEPNNSLSKITIFKDVENHLTVHIGNNAIGKYYDIISLENMNIYFDHWQDDKSPQEVVSLFVYYNHLTDILNISTLDYGDTTQGIDIYELVGNGWYGGPLQVKIEASTQSSDLNEDSMWFDNFIINTGNIINWPPRTDIDRDGFITIYDLEILTEYWLSTDNELDADINSDGIVNLLDLTKLFNAW